MSKARQVQSEERQKRIAALLVPPRITDLEKERLKTVFGLEEVPYRALRDLFFGFPLDEVQKQVLTNMSPVKDILTKVFLPTLSKDIAIGQNYDLWQTQDIKAATPDLFPFLADAKKELLKMIKVSLQRLDNLDLPGVNLDILEPDFSLVIARNGYISYVDQQIRFLVQFSNMDSMTDEERLRMLQMNSGK